MALSRRERRGLALLLAAAGLVRWLAWARGATLFNDGPRFLAIAQALSAGAWEAALRAGYHPLYPLATVAVQRAVPDWELAGVLVSIAGGIASVAFLFLLLRDAFGSPAAWAGAVLLAVHSRAIDYASDVQSDGLYAALFLAGVWFGWRALRVRSARLAGAAGLASGLAYATRPEGLELALVLGLIASIEMARGPWVSAAAGRLALRDGLRWIAALGAGVAAVAVPYVVVLEQATGAWAITPKRSVAGVGAPPASHAAPPRGADPAAEPPLWSAYLEPSPAASIDPEAIEIDESEDGMAVLVARTPEARVYAAAKMLARTAKSSMRYGVLALVLLGLLASRGRPGARGRFLGTLVGTHLGLLFVFTLSVGYVSRRHTLPALLPLLGYAGLGAAAAGSWIETQARALLGRSVPGGAAAGGLRGSLVAACIVAAVAAGELARQIPPRRADELAGRRASEWLRRHAPTLGPVAATRLRLGYYAGMPYVSLEGVADAALGPYLERARARYAVVDTPERAAAIERAPGLHARQLEYVEIGRGRAWVFELSSETQNGVGSPPAS